MSSPTDRSQQHEEHSLPDSHESNSHINEPVDSSSNPPGNNSNAAPRNAEALLTSELWQELTGPGKSAINRRILNMAEWDEVNIGPDDLQRVVNEIEALQADIAAHGHNSKKADDLAKLLTVRDKADINGTVQPNANTLKWGEFKLSGRELTLEDALRMTEVMRPGQLPSTRHLYRGPPIVRDVPIEPITEDDPYWDPEWLSFRSPQFSRLHFIERLHDSYRREKAIAGMATPKQQEDFRLEQAYSRQALNQINVIKRYFQEGITIHPNQLISKQFMHPKGLCKRYVLYNLCCDLARLLAIRHDTPPGAVGLHMSPIDFVPFKKNKVAGGDEMYRWLLELSEPDGIKTGSNQPRKMDPLFRKAILHGAKIQGYGNVYLGAKDTRKNAKKKQGVVGTDVQMETDQNNVEDNMDADGDDSMVFAKNETEYDGGDDLDLAFGDNMELGSSARESAYNRSRAVYTDADDEVTIDWNSLFVDRVEVIDTHTPQYMVNEDISSQQLPQLRPTRNPTVNRRTEARVLGVRQGESLGMSAGQVASLHTAVRERGERMARERESAAQAAYQTAQDQATEYQASQYRPSPYQSAQDRTPRGGTHFSETAMRQSTFDSGAFNMVPRNASAGIENAPSGIARSNTASRGLQGRHDQRLNGHAGRRRNRRSHGGLDGSWRRAH
ncbi:hypothetical protein ACHAQA_010123 [Verticillium albo-atrum]